jgi:hypothetical protein
MTGGLVMGVGHIGERPHDCDGCDWTYLGDGGRWRLTRIDPACPVHGQALSQPGPTS